ncbi:MAG TPA: site-2 protease family protein [Tissierellaceae bacterium]|nr:site-2 protease family protein [Tissierellaceae bacterium]
MDYIYNIPGLLVAIVFHELAHGLTAYILGDDTAKKANRLTINPIKHIDPIGFISMFIFGFGWAKPVPVNPLNFKRRKRDMLLVSLAGPLSNFLIAIITIFIFNHVQISSPILARVLVLLLWYNIMLGIFNLLPFPPLDGSKILASLLPGRIEFYFYKYERYLRLLLILLIFTNWIDKILSPIINAILDLLFIVLV